MQTHTSYLASLALRALEFSLYKQKPLNPLPTKNDRSLAHFTCFWVPKPPP